MGTQEKQKKKKKSLQREKIKSQRQILPFSKSYSGLSLQSFLDLTIFLNDFAFDLPQVFHNSL